MMTTLIADYLSEKNDNLKVVYNVNVSPHALSILESKGVSLFRCKVGHSNIKAMMKELEADFGGEHSAHFYYKDNSDLSYDAGTNESLLRESLFLCWEAMLCWPTTRIR